MLAPLVDRDAIDGQSRRREDSRKRLLAAAGSLFVECGYESTRPQDIARRAGVAAGTFYLHFSDKKDAFFAFAQEAQTQLGKRYAQNLHGVTDIGERLKIILHTMVSFAQERPGVLQAAYLDPVVIAPRDDEAWRLYDGLSHFAGLALGTDAEPRMALISHGLCGFMRHALIFAGRRQLDMDDAIDQIVHFLVRGFDDPVDPTLTTDRYHRPSTDVDAFLQEGRP